MIKVGLTGGIGSGKTNVTKTLAELGAKIINADLIGHQVYAPNTPTFHKVVDYFGKEIVSSDGTINRKALGAKVFADKSELQKLNELVWPDIKAKAIEELETLKQEGKTEVAVIEAAILIEAGWKDIVDKVWVITVPPDVAKSRIMKRNNLTDQEAEQRIKSQMSNEERIKHADYVIDTNGPFEQTRQRVIDAWNQMRKSCGLTPSF